MTAGFALAGWRGRERWLPTAAFALLALGQLAVIFWAIWLDPVQVPWQDELFNYAFFMRGLNGVITWADLWQPIGGVHRTVFPRLLYVLTIDATAWDRRIWLTIAPLLIVGACAAFVAAARRTAGERTTAIAFLAPAGALLLALSQYSQWLQPFGLQFALVVCCCAVAIWALTARPTGWPQVTLAVGAVWIASWSGLHGLVLWGALLPLALLVGWRKAALWVICAVAVIGSYARDLPPQGNQRIAPGELLTFTLENLGAPLGTLQNPASRLHFWNHTEVHLSGRWALWIGVASVALFLINLIAAWRLGPTPRAVLGHYLPWCCLALFAIVCAALTGIGRAAATTNSALTARYQTFALLWWLALLIVGWQVMATPHRAPETATRDWRRALAALNMGALAVGLLLFTWVNLVSGLLLRDLHAELRQSEACARDLAASPDACLTLLHPVPSVARLRLAGLAEARLALFRDGSPAGMIVAAPPATTPDPARLRALPIGALYAIDGLPGALAYFDGTPPSPHFSAAKPLQFTGWAIDPIAVPASPAGGVFLAIDDRPPVWLPLAAQRPEIAARFDPRLASSGFALELPAGTLAPGRHTARLTVVTADGRASYQPSPPLVFFVD